MATSGFPEKANFTWSRDEISGCECSEKPYRHVHCPCLECNGRATDRKTELRHWKGACEFVNRSMQSDVDLHIFHDNLPEDDECDQLSGEDDETVVDPNPRRPLERCTFDDADDSDITETVETNPLKKFVVKAVLDALRIKHESGASIRTFEDVLEYGRELFFSSLSEDMDVEILTTLWPKSWSDVQLLLKEEGYEDVKEYFVCFCFDEIEFTRDGKTTKKTVYHGTFSIMESKHDKCPYCGKVGYIKYLYLGLENKVKNWFRNKTMCKRMLSHWLEKDHWLDNSEDCQLKKEIWDGKRWSELQWFRTQRVTWALPTLCLHCGIPI